MVKRVLVIGAAFVDVIVNVPQLPTAGGDVTGMPVSSVVGGCAFNVDGALRRAEVSSDLLVPVGQGQYAEVVRQTMAAKHIPLLLQVQGMDNGWDLCMVEPNGERTFLTVPGVEQKWEPAWFEKLPLSQYDYVYLSGYEAEDEAATTVILDVLAQKAPQATLLFDASPRIRHIQPAILARLLSPGVMIHCNQDELAFMAKGADRQSQLKALYHLTQQPVMLTLGAQGTCLFDDQGERIIPAEKVNVVNTIGAGDTHCGGVLAGLALGQSIDEAVQLGNHLAALVVQQVAGRLD